MPAESIPAFKLSDLIEHATIIPGALYNTVLILAMNEDKWKSLRPEDRDAITRISGETFARNVGRAYAKGDLAAYESLKKAGKSVEPLSPAVLAEVKNILKPIDNDWAEKVRKKGVADPQKLINQLRTELAK